MEVRWGLDSTQAWGGRQRGSRRPMGTDQGREAGTAPLLGCRQSRRRLTGPGDEAGVQQGEGEHPWVSAGHDHRVHRNCPDGKGQLGGERGVGLERRQQKVCLRKGGRRPLVWRLIEARAPIPAFCIPWLTSNGGGGRGGVGICGRLLNLAPFRTSWMWSLNLS